MGCSRPYITVAVLLSILHCVAGIIIHQEDGSYPACSSDYCQHGVACENITVFNNTVAQCSCPEPYHGVTCSSSAAACENTIIPIAFLMNNTHQPQSVKVIKHADGNTVTSASTADYLVFVFSGYQDVAGLILHPIPQVQDVLLVGFESGSLFAVTGSELVATGGVLYLPAVQSSSYISLAGTNDTLVIDQLQVFKCGAVEPTARCETRDVVKVDHILNHEFTQHSHELVHSQDDQHVVSGSHEEWHSFIFTKDEPVVGFIIHHPLPPLHAVFVAVLPDNSTYLITGEELAASDGVYYFPDDSLKPWVAITTYLETLYIDHMEFFICARPEPCCCSVEDDPRVTTFDGEGMDIDVDNNTLCNMVNTLTEVNDVTICRYKICVSFENKQPKSVTVILRAPGDPGIYLFHVPAQIGDTFPTTPVITVTQTGGLSVAECTVPGCDFKISLDVGVGAKARICIERGDPNLDACHGGLCGNCNNIFDDYVLRNGTDVSHLPDKFAAMKSSFCQ